MLNNDVFGKIPNKNRRWLVEISASAAADEGYDISSFTENDLEYIDEILKKLKNGIAELPKSEYEEVITGASIEYAAAIIEVLENKLQKKGTWYYHHKKYGQNTFPYVLDNGNVIFPYFWCIKRISTPESDSIVAKYMQLAIKAF